jgi:gamma-glutamylcyclotransferase (GGCT)/AIG2-like uncharacterized protein YtfP
LFTNMKALNLRRKFITGIMHHIFVYGTLQLPGIVKKLTGKTFNTYPAVLPGYQLFCVKDSDYPAILKNENAKTKGLTIEISDDLSLAVISFFEGDEYQAQEVTVFTDGKSMPALAFVWTKGDEFLENREWDLQRFEKESLEHYLNVVIPETLEEFNLK